MLRPTTSLSSFRRMTPCTRIRFFATVNIAQAENTLQIRIYDQNNEMNTIMWFCVEPQCPDRWFYALAFIDALSQVQWNLSIVDTIWTFEKYPL